MLGVGVSGECDLETDGIEETLLRCKLDVLLGPGPLVKAQSIPRLVHREHRMPPSHRILLAWQASQARTRLESE
jgi:hypothetical protein